MEQMIRQFAESLPVLKKVLLIPPDHTRKHSGAGRIAAMLARLLGGAEVDLLPALGTHAPMSTAELQDMFGDLSPFHEIIEHNWREDTVSIGTIPGSFVTAISEGLLDCPVDVKVNRRIVSGEYDRIISIGQVVPHEVVGMANYSKNIFVGCGGQDMINKSHFLGAVYGMERILGRDHSPVRKLYDYAQDQLLSHVPIDYILTANATTMDRNGQTEILGIFIDRARRGFEQAVRLSQEKNITKLPNAVDTVVVYLDPQEYRSTWLGCKAVYRSRMAIADGGRLVMIAPGIEKFGEDGEIDGLIRRFGYRGRDQILQAVAREQRLKDNLSAAAHLIHGSAEGRFTITLASEGLTAAEIEQVNFQPLPLAEAESLYSVDKLALGYNQVNGKSIYFIDNPATGLWVAAEKWEME